MRFLLLLTVSVVEVATFLAKWLFIVTAPVLLIVVTSYCQAGKSWFEPFAALALVSGIFAASHVLSARLNGTGATGWRNNPNAQEATVNLINNDAGTWRMPIDEEGWQRTTAEEDTRRQVRLRAELWRQANPWGGYNPFE